MARDKRIRAGAVDLEYDELAGGGRPLVVVHGFTACRHEFGDRYADLEALGRTVLYDHRGHGGSQHTGPGSYDLDVLAGDLEAFLDALAIERCDLLGHSMGGLVTLRFALARPTRVASLVMMNTSSSALEWADTDAFRTAWDVARNAGMEVLQAALQKHAQDDPRRSRHDRRVEEEWGERYWAHHRHRFHSMDPHAYAELGLAMVETPSLETRLAEVECPTLVIVGDEDTEFLASSDALAAGIPDSVQVRVPDAAHNPHKENASAWTEGIRAHLERARA